MNLKPVQANVFVLMSEKGETVAIIKDRVMYSVKLLDDDRIAALFNGGDVLPLVPAGLAAKLP